MWDGGFGGLVIMMGLKHAKVWLWLCCVVGIVMMSLVTGCEHY